MEAWRALKLYGVSTDRVPHRICACQPKSYIAMSALGGKLTLASYDARMDEETKSKPSVRKRAEEIKAFRCKNLIAVIENPTDIKNIGTVIRNVNALGVEKVYVVDPHQQLPDDW